VLKGEPNEDLYSRASIPETPRARGEHQRREQQKQTIDLELLSAVFDAARQSERTAIEAFAGEIAPLSWSNPSISLLARQRASKLTENLTPPVVNVCADMRAWAQSGYQVLSPSTRALQATRIAASRDESESTPAIGTLLEPYEDAADHRLVRRTEALDVELAAALFANPSVLFHLERALGAPKTPGEEQEQEPVLARGTTSSAGTSFIVRREAPSLSSRSACSFSVSLDFRHRTGRSAIAFESSGSSLCLAGQAAGQLSTGCGNGVQTITVAVPTSVHSAELRLSNGRIISSPIVVIRRKGIEVAGLYAQAIRGYSVHPVTLTELDANGTVVKVEALHVPRCSRDAAPKPPRFVELAKGSVPDGEPFTIQGTSFASTLNLELGPGVQGHGEEESVISVGPGSRVKPKAFPWSLTMECQPHEFAILYGILAAPGDSVLARMPAGLIPLTTVAIAPDLHSGGPLVYGVFSTLPSELVVLRSDGSVLYTESLAAKAKEEAQFCEGYEEP
jgi:hypothetical protein